LTHEKPNNRELAVARDQHSPESELLFAATPLAIFAGKMSFEVHAVMQHASNFYSPIRDNAVQ
jgi:hypothetical protein